MVIHVIKSRNFQTEFLFINLFIYWFINPGCNGLTSLYDVNNVNANYANYVSDWKISDKKHSEKFSPYFGQILKTFWTKTHAISTISNAKILNLKHISISLQNKSYRNTNASSSSAMEAFWKAFSIISLESQNLW